MRRGSWRVVLFALLLGGPAGLYAATAPSPPAPAPAPAPAIDPQADAVLHRMSSYLSGLKSFTFQTQSFEEAVTTDGQKISFPAAQQVAVERPNKLRSEKVGPDSDTVFRYDGQRFSLFGTKTGYYAQAPAPPQLDQAIDAARQQFNIDAPAADLLDPNPYAGLMDGVTSGRYVGVEMVDGVPCHHLAYRTNDVDWQIWVQDGPQAIPRRYQITTKNVAGQPEYAVNLMNFVANPALAPDLFTFRPPPGAQEVPLKPAPLPQE